MLYKKQKKWDSPYRASHQDPSRWPIKLFLENCDCLGILSIRSVNKELYAGEMKVLEIKDLSMFREFDFVQLQGQENGLPALFMQFAEHYKEKL